MRLFTLNMFTILGLVLCVLIGIFAFQYLWSRRKLYTFANQLSGPVALPIIGNGLMFNCKSEDMYDIMLHLFRKYESPMRIWLGPKLIAVFVKLPHVERLLSSTKITYKGEIYKFLASIGGNGLVTGSGPKWKEHRRLIQPMLNLKFVTAHLEIIQKHTNKLIKSLGKLVDRGLVDIEHYLHACCFDIMGESICGVEMNTQEGQNMDLYHYFEVFYGNVFTQMIKPWLHPNIFFNMTHYKKERDVVVEGFQIFFRDVIEQSRKRLSNDEVEVTGASPIIDNIIAYIGEKPIMNEQELVDHLATLYAASEDTTTLIISSLCLCLGMYPEYQTLAANEIRDVFGDTPREVTEDDLGKLKYLEICIKEALRLFPIAPFILRKCTEELTVGEYTIPVGCEVLIPIDLVHRDPQQWKNPEHFYPDHFLPENIERRHIYAYIPFSAGPRVCIGKYLAMHVLKVIAANLLQHFSFEAEGKYPDLKFKTDISVRVKNGYNLKISKRRWT